MDILELTDKQEKKLQNYFMKNDGMMFLDDDLPDAFDAWVSNLNEEELNNILK